MRQLSPEELRAHGALVSSDFNGLLENTGLTPPRKPIADDYDAQMSGAVQATNSRGSLAARKGKKDETLWLNSFYKKSFDFIGDDDDGLFGGHRRPRGRRKPNVDSRRKVNADGERKPNGEDGEKKPQSEDGERKPNAEGDGERKPDVEGDGNRQPHADAESNRTPNIDAPEQKRTTDADTSGRTRPVEVAAEGDHVTTTDTTPETERITTAEAPRVSAEAPETMRAPEVDVEMPVTEHMAAVDPAPDARAITPELPAVDTLRTADVTPTRIAPLNTEAPRVLAELPEAPRAPVAAETAPDVARAITPDAPETIRYAQPLAPDMTRVHSPMPPSVQPDVARPIIVDLDRIPALRPVEPNIADIRPTVNVAIDAPIDTPHAPAARLSPALGGIVEGIDIPDYAPQAARAIGADIDVMDIPPEMHTPEAGRLASIDVPQLDAAPRHVTPSMPETPRIGIETPDLSRFFSASHDAIRIDTDVPEMRAPDLVEARIITPTTDAATIRANAPATLGTPDIPDAAPTVRTTSALSPWGTHLENRGSSMEAFNDAVETRAPDSAIDIGSKGADSQAARVNAGRQGRFTRLIMPNGLDWAFIGGFAGLAAIQTSSIAFGDEADISIVGIGVDLNGRAIGGAAADATPWVDAIAAQARGRDAEATVRLIVNGVETATPFAFAAAGAAWGGTGGAAAGGISAIPAALLGGTGGFVVGLLASGAISVAVDEGLRATARGMGYDVDRGFISSWLAPEFADDMEGWVSRVYGEGASLPEGATPQQIVDDILESTDDPIEQVARFREFMTIMNGSMYATQEEHLAPIKDIVEQQTGITDLRAVLDGPPEAREDFLSFYQNRLEQDPDNETAQMVVNAVAEYYALQENRFTVQQAILNADIMNSISLNEDIRDNVDHTLANMHHAFMAINMQEDMVPELIEINAEQRLHELHRFIETQQDDVNTETNTLIEAVAANGGDAYTATGSTRMITESLALYDDMEEALDAAADRIVTTHMGGFQIFFDNYERLEDDIETAIEEYGERAPESVAELQRIIANSNGFENLTEEQKVALAQNIVFRDAMYESTKGGFWPFTANQNQDLKDAYFDLEHKLDQSGYSLVMNRLGLISYQRTELESTLGKFGVDYETGEATPEMLAENRMRMDPRMTGPR